jgi:hypothetical protein
MPASKNKLIKSQYFLKKQLNQNMLNDNQYIANA